MHPSRHLETAERKGSERRFTPACSANDERSYGGQLMTEWRGRPAETRTNENGREGCYRRAAGAKVRSSRWQVRRNVRLFAEHAERFREPNTVFSMPCDGALTAYAETRVLHS